MKKIYLLFFTLFAATVMQAQVANYSWSALSSLTYTPLSGGTVVNTAAGITTGTTDDGGFVVTLPFTFTYNGTPFTTVTMCTNGWVGMGNQAATTNVANGRAPGNLFSATAPNNVIAGWFGDNNANIPTPGSMVYGLLSPDVFVFEWNQSSGASGGATSTTNLISYQVVLYGPASATPGRIECLYGPATAAPTTARSVGLGGTGTDYKNGLSGSSSSTATSTGWPGNGTGFRFDTPLPCASPTAQPTSLVLTPASTTTSGVFTAASPAPNAYLVVRTTGAAPTDPQDGTVYTAGTSALGGTIVGVFTASPFSATALTGNTAYTYWIYSVNNSCSGGPKYLAASPLTAAATTCPSTPGTITTSNITTTSFTLNWASAAGGNALPVIYTVDVATDAAFTSPVAGSPFTVNDPTVSQTVSGLSVSTPYYYRITASNGCSSASSTTATVTTACNPTTVPISEGFESITVANTLPACMSASDLGNKCKTYTASATGTNSALIARTGSKFAAIYWNPSATAGWFFSAPVTLTAGTSYRASVWYKTDATAWTDAGLYFGTSPTGGSMTNTIVSVANAQTTTYAQMTGDFVPSTTGVYYIGIRGYNATTAPNYIAFDDFNLDLTPSCVAPTGVTVGTITTTTASVSFTGAGASYIVEYGAPGFTPGTGSTAGTGGTIVTGTTSPISLTGLTASTPYDVYIRQDCTAALNGYSANTAVTTFTTACSNATVPYSEGFNTSGLNVNPVCWSQQFVTGSLPIQFVTTTQGTSPVVSTPYEGTRMVFYNSYSNSTSTRLVSRPLTTTGTASIDVNFQWYFSTSGGVGSYPTEGVTVQWSTDGSTWNDFTGNFIRRYGPVQGWAPITLTMPAGAGNQPTVYIGLKLTGNGGYDTYLDAFSVTASPVCTVPGSVNMSFVTSTTASVNFTGSGTSYIVEYGATGFTPGTGATAGTGGTVVTGASSPILLSGLTPSTAYSVYVRQDCTGSSNGYSANSGVVSFTTGATPPVNDEASGALPLNLGAGCASGSAYTNVAASQSAGEPYASCYESAGTHTVWFKFTAPASGNIKASSEFAGGTLTDTHLALFSAGTVTDYSTFTIISCDDDNGNTIGTTKSILYATGLTPNQDYYLLLDGYNGSTGTFCIAVDELNSSMLSTTNNCSSSYQTPSGSTSYKGQVPLVDNSGNLIAIVKNAAGGAVNLYSVAQNISTGPVRQTGGVYYLDRNYRIVNAVATNVDVQFFFLNTELAALTAADPTINIGNLGAIKQTDATCRNDFATANGAFTQLTQTGSGTDLTNGVSWIAVNTPNFSNFFLDKAGIVAVAIEYFHGSKVAAANYLNWKVNSNETVTLELERSADGRRFSSIQNQVASSIRCLQEFSYTDAASLSGISYYRLKIISPDGSFRYSSIVALINGTKGFELISLAPNPVYNTTVLSVSSVKSGKLDITVSDVTGKTMMSRSVTVIAGNTALDLNFAQLGAGTYQITAVNADGERKTTRFVKY